TSNSLARLGLALRVAIGLVVCRAVCRRAFGHRRARARLKFGLGGVLVGTVAGAPTEEGGAPASVPDCEVRHQTPSSWLIPRFSRSQMRTVARERAQPSGRIRVGLGPSRRWARADLESRGRHRSSPARA